MLNTAKTGVMQFRLSEAIPPTRVSAEVIRNSTSSRHLEAVILNRSKPDGSSACGTDGSPTRNRASTRCQRVGFVLVPAGLEAASNTPLSEQLGVNQFAQRQRKNYRPRLSRVKCVLDFITIGMVRGVHQRRTAATQTSRCTQ
jgi:hypothetical protein